ncbi:MAG: iron-containing alcohol dehydrogenase [Christensenellaceae bacterium]|nr:iron-containing alcohol dehydrogenase [Christensenellaceae bacterium]
MINCEYYNPTMIIFGKDTEKQVGELVSHYAKSVLVVYGGKSAKASGLLDRVFDSLKEAGISYMELGGVKPNPRLSLVYEGIEIAKKNNIEMILAVGGGSVIDTAKGIAAGAVYDGDVWDFYTVTLPEKALPVATVLTIPAAGSESSTGSVITNEEKKEKRACDHECLIPKFSILNPELTYTLPNYQIACGVADAMAHIFERYFSNEKAADVTDRLGESVLKSLMKYAPIAIKENENYEARAEIMWACKIAHDGTLGVGKIGDWASHNIEHELSAFNDVAHGAGLAIVFPAWMRYTYKQDKNLFLQFVARVLNVDIDYEYVDYSINLGIDKLKEFFKSIGLPTSLSEIGIYEKDIRGIAEHAIYVNDGEPLGNFVKLSADDIENIYRLAL